MIKLKAPFSREEASALRAGDKVFLSGTVYTARDAAHKRLIKQIEAGEEPPFELNGAVIYYVGPTPAPEGAAIGSAGPTTSGRMDAYTPMLLDLGLAAMIGKGGRCAAVVQSMIKNEAVYFAAVGGAGALIARCVESSRIVAYPDLGTEAIRELVVREFPLIVAIDAKGGNLYQKGPESYLKNLAAL